MTVGSGGKAAGSHLNKMRRGLDLDSDSHEL